MRVAIVCGSLRPRLDGVADAAVALAAALRAEGAVVRILHTGPPSPEPGAVSAGTRWGPAALHRAARLLRGADVVHVQWAPSMYRGGRGIGLLPAVLGRVSLVTTVHEFDGSRRSDVVWRWLGRRRLADRETALLVPRSRAVIVTNAAHERAVTARLPGARVIRIPIGANVGVHAGVDPARARSAVRTQLGLPASALLVVFFGFVHPVKGVRYLAEAIAALRSEGRAAHLLVVGGFESMALPADEAAAFEVELRGQVDRVGMTPHTTVTGWLDAAEVSRLLAASDLAVLPFTGGVTGKSGSLLTVFAHGLPTVVTAPPDPEPELADGEHCVVVRPVRDAAAIADGIRRLLDDPALAERVAAGGRSLAASRDWGAIARRHLALYRSVRR